MPLIRRRAVRLSSGARWESAGAEPHRARIPEAAASRAAETRPNRRQQPMPLITRRAAFSTASGAAAPEGHIRVERLEIDPPRKNPLKRPARGRETHPQPKEPTMPLIRVELFDYRITPEVSEKLIEKHDRRAVRGRPPRPQRPHLGHRRGSRPEELGRRRQAVAGRRDAARAVLRSDVRNLLTRRSGDAGSRETEVAVVGAGLAGLVAAPSSSPQAARWSCSRRATASAGACSTSRSAASRTSSAASGSRRTRARLHALLAELGIELFHSLPRGRPRLHRRRRRAAPLPR